MISKTELQLIKKKRGGNLYYLEKEYLQFLFLFRLFEKSHKFVFKGGTCLRIAYGHMRMSEDLDFNSTLQPNKIKKYVHEVLDSISLVGIEHRIVKEELFENNYTAKMRFKGPLYSDRPDSMNSLRIEVGKKITRHSKWVSINKIFSDVPQFFALVMAKEEILAEKIRALIMRKTSRDLFDIWTMKDGVKINKALIKLKLGEVNTKFKNKIEFCSKKEYERELRNLLPVLPIYEQVCEDTEDFWKKIVEVMKNA